MTKPTTSKTGRRVRAGAPPTLPPPNKTPKGLNLEVPMTGTREPPDQFMAKLAAAGVAGNARSLVLFGTGTFGELSLTECVAALQKTADGLNDGDLSSAITMLASQAMALNAIFGELARRSALNMGEYLDASERYMRLALKAQGQCRATLETLAAIKNPPVVFARQANIAHGAQQVNNSVPPAPAERSKEEGAAIHAREIASEPNELLEDCTHGCTQLDTRTTAAAGGTNQGLEPVGAFDRTAHQ